MKQRIRYKIGAVCVSAVLLLNTGFGLFSSSRAYATVADEATASDTQTGDETPVRAR